MYEASIILMSKLDKIRQLGNLPLPDKGKLKAILVITTNAEIPNISKLRIAACIR